MHFSLPLVSQGAPCRSSAENSANHRKKVMMSGNVVLHFPSLIIVLRIILSIYVNCICSKLSDLISKYNSVVLRC